MAARATEPAFHAASSPRIGAAAGEVSSTSQDARVDGVDLDLGDAVVDVSEQAAAAAVAAHALDQHAVLGVQAEQLERAAGLGDGLLAEDHPRADQVLDLADVVELLRGQNQRRVLRPPEPIQAVDQPAPVAARRAGTRPRRTAPPCASTGPRTPAASRRPRSASAWRRRAARPGRSPTAGHRARAGSAPRALIVVTGFSAATRAPEPSPKASRAMPGVRPHLKRLAGRARVTVG